jgi:hypothetical protein
MTGYEAPQYHAYVSTLSATQANQPSPPAVCSIGQVGFGALLRGFIAGKLWAALQSGRVLMMHPEVFPYGGCKVCAHVMGLPLSHSDTHIGSFSQYPSLSLYAWP